MMNSDYAPTHLQSRAHGHYYENDRSLVIMPRFRGKTRMLIEQAKQDVLRLVQHEPMDRAFTTLVFVAATQRHADSLLEKASQLFDPRAVDLVTRSYVRVRIDEHPFAFHAVSSLSVFTDPHPRAWVYCDFYALPLCLMANNIPCDKLRMVTTFVNNDDSSIDSLPTLELLVTQSVEPIPIWTSLLQELKIKELEPP